LNARKQPRRMKESHWEAKEKRAKAFVRTKEERGKALGDQGGGGKALGDQRGERKGIRRPRLREERH
jgi:hypothetical protein